MAVDPSMTALDTSHEAIRLASTQTTTESQRRLAILLAGFVLALGLVLSWYVRSMQKGRGY